MEIPRSLAILREACALNATSFEVVDTFTGFVARISRGGRSQLVGAAGIGVYPINRAAPFAIARDKAFTHYVLERAGFQVPDGGHFFLAAPNRYDLPAGRSRTDLVRFAQRLSDDFARPLVVKPNSGKGAKLVTFVRSEASLQAAVDAIGKIDSIALVQAFVDEPEFRLFLVDGEVAFAYQKSRASVEGDGKSSVRALCEAAMHERPVADWNPFTGDYLRMMLDARGLSLDSVLAKRVRLPVDFVSNISASGRFSGFVEPTLELRRWASRLARTVSLRVTGVDVFSHSALANVSDIVVTDVNGSPNLGTLYDIGHKALVLDIWRGILDRVFTDTWPEGF